MFDLKEYKIYDELNTLKYMLSKEKRFKNYDKIIDEIINLCIFQKRKIKELEEKELMNRKINQLAETKLLSYGQGYEDGINKETTASAIVTRERENQIIYEGMKHKINNEWRLKIKIKLWELNKNERERINKIKNPNEMFPDLIYISNKKILEQLLKEGEENVWSNI